jgi:hypothetical protein
LNGLRPRTILTLLGQATFHRHYYHCPDCHCGTTPWDAVLGLDSTRQSPATQEVVALGGTIGPFAEAAEKVIGKMTSLRVSESTARRTTEAVGAEIGEILVQGEVFGEAEKWKWHKDAEGKTIAYVSRDATGVGIQGAKGSKADGRMINVGMVYNPVPEEKERRVVPTQSRPAWQTRYVASMNGVDGLSVPMRQQGAQVGMDDAERWIGLCDAGNGLEEALLRDFPRVEVIILDFFHAAEYLGEIACAWHPGDADAAAAWLGPWCHRLKHEGGEAALNRLRELQASSDVPKAVRGKLEDAIRYFENQKHRMDYPTYQAKGWQIGSGPVESACKTVIGMRMKQAGMRWGTKHAAEIGHIRALFRSGDNQWDDFWRLKQQRRRAA